MRYVTNLMDKVFSASTPESFKDAILNGIAEAKQKGFSEYKSETDHYVFAETDGDVVIEDKKHDSEMTIAKDEGNEIKLEGSATQPSVQTVKPSGADKPVEKPGSTEPAAKVDDAAAVSDKDKAGVDKHYSDFFELKNYTFSDEEMESAADAANKLEELDQRVKGTDDPELAKELKDKAECMKSYSILADRQGINTSALYEMASTFSENADEMLNRFYSEMDVNEYFSNMSEDEINKYFSGLDEVEAQILYSALMDEENYTFSEVEEAINAAYSDLQEQEELGQSIQTYFSEMSEDEINEVFSELSNQEAQILYSMLMDEESDHTFSEVNEAFQELNSSVNKHFSELDEYDIQRVFSNLSNQEANILYSALIDEENDHTFSDIYDEFDYINQPLNEMFSNMTDEEVKEFTDSLTEEECNILYSMATDEEKNYTFSDFLDVHEEMNTFSEADAQQIIENAEAIKKAAEDMKESKDEELAKKVKVLADKCCEDAEIAKESGFEDAAEKVNEQCKKYSEEAAKVLDEKGIDPKSIDPEQIMAEISKIEDKAGHAEQAAQEAKKEVAEAKKEAAEAKKEAGEAKTEAQPAPAPAAPAEPATPAAPAEPAKTEPTTEETKTHSDTGEFTFYDGKSGYPKTFSKPAEELDKTKVFSEKVNKGEFSSIDSCLTSIIN